MSLALLSSQNEVVCASDCVRIIDIKGKNKPRIFKDKNNPFCFYSQCVHLRSAPLTFTSDSFHHNVENDSLSSKLLVALRCDGENVIKVFNSSKRKFVSNLEGHDLEIGSMISQLGSNSNAQLISSSINGVIKFWNVEREKEINAIDVTGGVVSLGNFYNDVFTSTMTDKKVKIWNTNTSKEINTISTNHEFSINCTLGLSERQILTGSFDRTIKLFDIRMLKLSMKDNTHIPLKEIKDFNGAINIMEKFPFDYFITCEHPSTMRIWDSRSFKQVSVIKNIHSSDLVSEVLALSDGRIISCGKDGKMNLFKFLCVEDTVERWKFINNEVETFNFQVILKNKKLKCLDYMLLRSPLLGDKKSSTSSKSFCKIQIDKQFKRVTSKGLLKVLFGKVTNIPREVLEEFYDLFKSLGLISGSSQRSILFKDVYRMSLKSLYKSKKGANLSIVTSDKERVKVHKEILIFSSNFFHMMLKFNWNESMKGEISIVTEYIKSKREMDGLLEYIYLGVVKSEDIGLLLLLLNHSMMYFEKAFTDYLIERLKKITKMFFFDLKYLKDESKEILKLREIYIIKQCFLQHGILFDEENLGNNGILQKFLRFWSAFEIDGFDEIGISKLIQKSCDLVVIMDRDKEIEVLKKKLFTLQSK